MTTKPYDPDVEDWLSDLKAFLKRQEMINDEMFASCDLCRCASTDEYNDFQPGPIETVPIVSKEKRFVQVETDVETLADLIRLAEEAKEKWDYGNPELTFSIDFGKLVAILPEMRELEAMVGLVKFKKTIVAQIVYFLQGLDRDAKGQVIDYKHMVLAGPPGVGKTEIAMIVARLFLSLGVITNNVFKKATRSDLVAGYLGQTAMKTAALIQSCLGGVLFIDEAYSLGDTGAGKQDTYSREAIDTLCEAMSFHKAELMVIIAGYQQEIDAFLDANQGLESRFLWRHALEPYSAAELAAIFDKKVAEAGWTRDLTPGWTAWFKTHRDAFTGAGRDMEKLLSFMKMSHARRIFGKAQEERKLTEQDRDQGWKLFQEHKGKEAKPPTSHQFYFV